MNWPQKYSRTLEEALLDGGRPFTYSGLPPGVLDGIPRYGWYRFVHDAAVANGASCYQDPISNELIATAAFLQRHPEHCSPYHRHGVRPRDSAEVPNSDGDDEADVLSDVSSASSSGGLRRLVGQTASRMQLLRLNASGRAASGGHAAGAQQAPLEAGRRRFASERRVVSAGPSPFLRKQSRPLIISELPDLEEILKLPHYAQTGRLHCAAEERGLDSYRDPSNGCVFFTRTFLSREACCGEDCRHCPYGRIAAAALPSVRGPNSVWSSSSNGSSSSSSSESSSSSGSESSDESSVTASENEG
jgi:hypothetical protein